MIEIIQETHLEDKNFISYKSIHSTLVSEWRRFTVFDATEGQ